MKKREPPDKAVAKTTLHISGQEKINSTTELLWMQWARSSLLNESYIRTFIRLKKGGLKAIYFREDPSWAGFLQSDMKGKRCCLGGLWEWCYWRGSSRLISTLLCGPLVLVFCFSTRSREEGRDRQGNRRACRQVVWRLAWMGCIGRTGGVLSLESGQTLRRMDW